MVALKRRVKLAKETFDEILALILGQRRGGPEDIIFDYILG